MVVTLKWWGHTMGEQNTYLQAEIIDAIHKVRNKCRKPDEDRCHLQHYYKELHHRYYIWTHKETSGKYNRIRKSGKLINSSRVNFAICDKG